MKPILLAAAGLLAVAGAAAAAPNAAKSAPAAPAAKAAVSPFAAIEKAKTVSVTETILAPGQGDPAMKPEAVLKVSIARPNLFRVEQTPPGAKTPDMIMVSDGTSLTQYMTEKKQYKKDSAPPHGLGTAGIPALQDIPASKAVSATLNGKKELLYTSTQAAGPQTLTIKLWSDPVTHLPDQQSVYLGKGAQAKEAQRLVFADWSLDKTIADNLFAFTPPAGATEYKEPQLLTKGVAAPDFTVQDPAGNPVKLSDYKGKVVVIDFWATWCGPCQASLPHTNKVAESFKDKNVVFLGVNVWDAKDKFDAWLPQHKDFDAIKFVIDPSPSGKDIATTLYNVTGIPTQYVIDPKGNVAQTFVGYSGPSDDLANAIKAAGAS